MVTFSSAYFDRKCSIMITIIGSAVRTVESSMTVLRGSLSVPKIMGIGSIIIAPPPLTFSVFLLFDKRISVVANMMISIPAEVRIVPRL